jgi:hypothetical protein
MAVKSVRKKIIIIIVIVVLVLSGGALTYAFTTGYFTPQKTTSDSSSSTGTAYKENFQKAEKKVDDLIASGDEQSLKEAEEIVDSEVSAANESGNDAYIVDANLAKATVLIETGRAQEALDIVLSTLDEKNASSDESNNEDYIVDAYLAKAGLLIESGHPQEALDVILLPLEKKYENNEAYKYLIFGQISWAYSELDNAAKSDEYFTKVPEKGWE